eukprot:UN24258
MYPLFWAAFNNYSGILAEIVSDVNININVLDHGGRTVLSGITEYDKNEYLKCLDLLLENKRTNVNAEYNVRRGEGEAKMRNILHDAIRKQSVEKLNVY